MKLVRTLLCGWILWMPVVYYSPPNATLTHMPRPPQALAAFERKAECEAAAKKWKLDLAEYQRIHDPLTCWPSTYQPIK